MLHKYENAVIVSSYSNLTVPAHDLLNANTFPDAAKTQCETARKRLEMFLYFSSIVPAVMERSTIQLQHFVEQRGPMLQKAKAGQNIDYDFVFESEAVEYRSVLHATLYSLKSFLDAFAISICSTYGSKYGRTKFSKKNIDGRKGMVGGTLVNWLRNLPSHFDEKNSLASLIVDADIIWLNRAINYRDRLAHYDELTDMDNLHMRIRLDDKQPYDFTSISPVIMPNGQPLLLYVQELQEQLLAFLTTFLSQVSLLKPI